MESLKLHGLDRLLQTCQRLGLEVDTTPPMSDAPTVGTRIGTLPVDPMLAAVHARMSGGLFASNETGLVILQVDRGANELERQNAFFQEAYQPRLALPLLVFGGEQLLAYYYATVPSLADEHDCHPVVFVDCYEEPHALPLASNIDRFFEAYARYLEALVHHPEHAELGSAALTFPRKTHDILARDERLVTLLRQGHFNPLMPQDEETRQWVERVLEAASAP